MKLDSTIHRPFFLAAILGTALAVSSHGSTLADEFRASDAIVKGLTPITDVEGTDRRAVDLDIRFKVNSTELTEAALRQLDALSAALKSERLAGSRFEINGHTDASGTAAYNMALSRMRAWAVKDYLVSRFAIQAERLDATGWGEARLKNPFNPRAPENRRVEIVNLTPPRKEKKETPPQAPQPPREDKDGDDGKGSYDVIN